MSAAGSASGVEEAVGDDTIRCDACPVLCRIRPGKTGALALGLGSVGAWVIALVYARGGRGALWACRIGLPLLGVAAVGFEGPAVITWLVGVVIGTTLAWTAAARLAVRPLVKR